MAINFKQFVLRDIYPRTLLIGHYSGCHQASERSFHIGIRQLPVCARCLGIYLGLPLIWLWQPGFALALVALIPLVCDGFVQLFTRYESTNWRRLATGLLFGWGIAGLLVSLI